MREAYLDNSATTKVDQAVADVVCEMMLEEYGNPSSLHQKGFNAQQRLENARRQVAAVLGCREDCIYFTSGGTEGDNIAIFGAAHAKKRRGNRIITTAIEHPAVLEPMKVLEKEGFEIVTIKPDSEGHIDEQAIVSAVDESTILVSMMAVNNELGTILPVGQAAKKIRKKNPQTLIHCDAVQGFGKLPWKIGPRFDVDFLSLSGHKIHAPKGVGALYIRRGVHIVPVLYGGGQEKGIRPGTENVPLACGLGLAAELAEKNRVQEEENVRLLSAMLRDHLEKMDGVCINSPQDATPYIVNFSVVGIRSEIMLHFLESRGVYVSSGSACAKGGTSHVLAAAGLPQQRADSALRVSFGRMNTQEDIRQLIDALTEGMSTIARSR